MPDPIPLRALNQISYCARLTENNHGYQTVDPLKPNCYCNPSAPRALTSCSTRSGDHAPSWAE
jgi:hypothetical protein